MSHYVVAVFTSSEGKSYDELLAPYNENITMAPYVSMTREQLVEHERKHMAQLYESLYKEWQTDKPKYEASCHNPSHIDYLKSLPDMMKRTDEEIYTAAIEGYSEDEITEDGSILSTYNPQSKWDWYELGGRWNGMLKLKPGAKSGKRGCPGVGGESSEDYDSALVSEIDFDAMRRDCAEHVHSYEDAKKNSYYKPSYFVEKYPTPEYYFRRCTEFSTYAVVTPDGLWHAPGVMGWWAMSSESAEEDRIWFEQYHDRFVKPALEKGWTLNIIDCHI